MVERGNCTQTQLTWYVLWIPSPLFPPPNKRGTTTSNHVQVSTPTQCDTVHQRNSWTSINQIRHRPSPRTLEVVHQLSAKLSEQDHKIFFLQTPLKLPVFINLPKILHSRNVLDCLGSLCLWYTFSDFTIFHEVWRKRREWQSSYTLMSTPICSNSPVASTWCLYVPLCPSSLGLLTSGNNTEHTGLPVAYWNKKKCWLYREMCCTCSHVYGNKT